jgi:hypothetical protein
MQTDSIQLSVEDFRTLNWQEVIEVSEKRECHYYSSAFLRKARECEEKSDKKNQAIYTILGGITSMMLKSESYTEPYHPVAVFNDRRSAIIDDYSDEIIDILSGLISDIKDFEMRARIGDIVWLRKRDYKAAQEAIESYLESAKLLEDPEHWTQCAERIERALRLSMSLGKGKSFDMVVNHIESVLQKYDGKDPKFLSQRLMSFLLEVRHYEPEKYIELSNRVAQTAETLGDYYRARSYWESKARWHNLSGDTEGEESSLISAAETYAKEAQSASSNLVAATHQRKAIEAYRQIGGNKERIDELHHRLLEYEKNTLLEMKLVSTPGGDISDLINRAIDSIKGKTFQEALFELVLQVSSPDITQLRKQVKESAAKYPLQHIFSGVKVNESGKVTARSTSMLSDNPEEIEKATQEGMFRQAEFHHQIYAQSVIEPIRKQINLEHNVRIQDFFPIVSNNQFIPKGREYLYALGFKSGIDGDSEIALHLLIPQFENSIRHILSQSGHITSGLDSDGIQDERSLNTTLYLPEIKNLVDENILFDLQGLLVERFGANLRNLMAHGLMSHHAFYSHQTSYLWCLILKICCLPIIRFLREQEDKNNIDDQK